MGKKFLAIGALLAASMLVSQGAQAKTLEDILKEKGVITEADYKEVTKSKPLDYKLGKGFTFTSADEKFQLSFGGRTQFRYTFTDTDTYSSSTTDSSKFDAQRLVLTLQGYAYTKDLTFRLEADVRQLAGTSRLGLRDAFLNYRLMDELQLLLGQTKVKFGYNTIQSDAALMFVDRSPLYTAFTPAYEIGAFAYGKAFNGLIDYAASVSNGDGQTAAASKNHNAFAARLAVSPLGAVSMDEPDLAISKKPVFTIGANYLHNTVDDNATTAYGGGTSNAFKVAAVANGTEVNSFGVDGHFKWMGLALQGEAIFMDADDTRALVYYGQAGYMITPKLGVAFRYTVQDPNKDVSGDLKSEQLGAVSYYFDKHALKVQADVGNIHNQSNGTDDLQFRAQVQLTF